MWKWLRSLRSRLFAAPEPAARQAPRQPSAQSYTTAPRSSQSAVLPSSTDKLSRLDWRPLAQAPVHEETLAPPLTSGPTDHAPILGIDLGTSHSVVAVVRHGKVEVIPNQEGEYLTPSVVAFTKDGQVLVGSPALRQAALNPQRTVYAIKRHLGRSAAYDQTTYEVTRGPEGTQVRLEGVFFTPAEISALILRKLLASAEVYLGMPIRRAVLTIPAAFDDAQRQSTLDAALLAGLDLQWVLEDPGSGSRHLVPMRVITEPTAAALSLGGRRARRTAVVHMGGGSFDISILDIGEGVFEMIATNGDAALGGQDFDQVLIDWFAGEFESRHGLDPRRDPAAYWRLKEAAEQAKKDLSQREEVRVEVPYLLHGARERLDLDLVINRVELERRTRPLINRCQALIRRSLDDARLTGAAIDDVLLVGGMMRMPRLQQLVRETFNKAPSVAVHSEEAVARGAAIQGAQLQLCSRSDLLLVDVSPLTFGLEADGGSFVTMIPRNTRIPTERTEVFTTASQNQSGVSIRVFQGDDSVAIRNRFLAQLDLDDLRPTSGGQVRIEVRFTMDHNGVLWVTGRDEVSGRKKTIRVARGRRLTPAEANDLRLKAERNAARRAQHEPLTAARGRAQTCLDRLANVLRKQPALEATGVSQLRALAEQIRQLMSADDAAGLQRAVEALELALEALDDWLERRSQQSHSEQDAVRHINLEL
jgi:molecular chaperone DnaK